MVPLCLNVNIMDLFYECEENDIANYADNRTPYSCTTDFPTVISELQAIPTKAFIGLEIIISKSIQVNVPYYLAIKVLRLLLLIEYK